MAAGSTYTPIYSTTLVSAQSSVTLNSFSGYTDLVLVMAPIVSSDTYNFLSINGAPSGSSHSLTRMIGNGSTATSSRESSQARINIWYSNASTPSNFIVNLQNYANTTTYKTILCRGNNTADSLAATVGLWSSTAAITSIVLTPQVGNYNIGSTFTLYGIKAA